jgi:GTPase-activator protein for Ras-like GTPase
VEDEELHSGRTSAHRPQGGEVSSADACRDPATRDLYIRNLRQLRELTNVFMLTIERNVSKIPFGIRYIARQIFQCLKVSDFYGGTKNRIASPNYLTKTPLKWLPTLSSSDS